MNDRADTARYLIEQGADVNADDWYGRTPLWAAVDIRNVELDGELNTHFADRAGALEIIRLLLARGANPNARTRESPPGRIWLMQAGSLSWVDFTGQTPFLRAALAGDVTTMRLLLEYKADPNIATFGGTTPLMAAAGVNWVYFQTFDEGQDQLLEAVKLCVSLGQDVNAANSMGIRAIHGAANRGSDAIVKYLVEQGARLDAKDNQGRSPYTWAEGVFLATHAAVPKPSTMRLIEELCRSKGQRCSHLRRGKRPETQPMDELIYFLGRFHVLILHVPVGVLMLAIGMEALSRWPRFFVDGRSPLEPAMPLIWGFGALAAVATVALGYMHASEPGFYRRRSGPSPLGRNGARLHGGADLGVASGRAEKLRAKSGRSGWLRSSRCSS